MREASDRKRADKDTGVNAIFVRRSVGHSYATCDRHDPCRDSKTNKCSMKSTGCAWVVQKVHRSVAMRIGIRASVSVFGRVNVSTPSLKTASPSSGRMEAGRTTEREKLPQKHSRKW